MSIAVNKLDSLHFLPTCALQLCLLNRQLSVLSVFGIIRINVVFLYTNADRPVRLKC